RAGTIRRVRQTLLATNLAEGALVAWKVPEDKIDSAFDWLFQRDPFSGHVVLRSTDTMSAGSDYKLWTTLKVPRGFSLQAHCELLAGKVGAERFRLMPAKGIFTLGVGHVRRKMIEPGSKVGRHHILTHCYWREAGPEFGNVNIMAVAHGTDKRLLLDHKAAIDQHLDASNIPVSYTNVFWGGRSEIKPSEISQRVYHEWLSEQAKS